MQELARKAAYWSVQGREVGLWGRRSRLAWPGHRVLHGQRWMVGGLGGQEETLDVVFCLSQNETEPWCDSTT